jgi:hypothetical protein
VRTVPINSFLPIKALFYKSKKLKVYQVVIIGFSTVEDDFAAEYICLWSVNDWTRLIFFDFLKTLDHLVESKISVFVVSEVERVFAGVAGDIRCCNKLADPKLKLLSAYRAGEIKHEKLE